MPAPVRVLIVDDSPVVRRVLTDQLNRQPGVEVVGDAADPYEAREKIVAIEPDVITLDMEMPKMDGLTFLRKLMKFHPIPTIVFSSVAQEGTQMAIECLEAGAIEVVAKPSGPDSIGMIAARLGELMRGVRDVKMSQVGASSPAPKNPEPAPVKKQPIPARPSSRLIAIGSSTGGTEALRDVLTKLPANLPGIVIVQHMPSGFTGAFSKRLNGICEIEVREAKDGDDICTGHALIAPGDKQMRVVRGDAGWKVKIAEGPRVCRHKPSVEVLFTSTAEIAGKRAMGVIMTGMGNDGAQGLKAMRDAGSYTIAQNEESCVVFGMPREAIQAGAACDVLHLNKIADNIIKNAKGVPAAAA